MKNARPNNRTDRPISTGASHWTATAAVLPATPNRARTPAVVQVGAAPTSAHTAPVRLVNFSFTRDS